MGCGPPDANGRDGGGGCEALAGTVSLRVG